MTRKTAPLPQVAIEALNEMIERQCSAQGPGFLRCWRLRGHDGAHHDPIQGIDWTAEPNGNEERVK